MARTTSRSIALPDSIRSHGVHDKSRVLNLQNIKSYYRFIQFKMFYFRLQCIVLL